jgi:hypothetical protein
LLPVPWRSHASQDHGVYVVRTTVAEAALDQTATVTAYKQLSTAERAFRSLKTVDLSWTLAIF